MSSSAPKEQTSTTKVEYSPQEQAARDKIMQAGLSNFDRQTQSGNQYTYTGPRPVDPSQTTLQSWQAGQAGARGMAQNTQNAVNANNWGMSDVLRSDANPYLQGHIQAAQRPLIESFMNAGGPMSTIRNNSVANGTFGGSRQGIAEGLAAQGLQRQLGDISATMQSGAYDRGLDTFDSSVKNSALMNMMMMQPAQALGAIGGQQEGYTQQNQNYWANVREQQKNGSWEPLQNLANIIYGGSNGTQTTKAQVPQQDNTGAAIGSMALMAMMMMSDKRLKRDIQRIGTHSKGFEIYSFVMGGVRQWGVLAQEVQRLFPELVDASGAFLRVDYPKLLEN